MRVRVVFDLDGTLIDSAPDIHAVANSLIAPHGVQISLAQTHAFIGNGVSVFVTRMLEAMELPDALHDEILTKFKLAYLTAVHHTRIYGGVVDALVALKATDHALGICTNKPLAPCMAVLDHLDLTPFFETFLGGDSLATHKPDPALLHAALADLGEGPYIYVGDSEVDAQTAQAADVPFLLYTEGYRKTAVKEIPHTAAFSDFADLPALVTRYAVSP
ncbi:MAG: HAD-IA family hydrolase [Sulfitobacter sp.]